MSLGNSASLTSDLQTQHLFMEILTRGGYEDPCNFAGASVAKIAKQAPRVVLVDLDHLASDSLECLRQLRFVLPECTIAAVSSVLQRGWAAQCHLAGASGVLSRQTVPTMIAGLRRAVQNGCYTDPRFAHGVMDA